MDSIAPALIIEKQMWKQLKSKGNQGAFCEYNKSTFCPRVAEERLVCGLYVPGQSRDVVKSL